jgi:hypothetical protein
VATEIAAANAVLDAASDADAKERDVQDAARIRGGAAPEDVRAERAAFDRDREIEKINRNLQNKGGPAQALFDDAQTARGNAQRVGSDPRATAEDRKKAADEAVEAERKANEALAAFEAAKKVAAEQRRGVRAEFEGTVADAAGDKKTRLEKEREAEAKRAADEQRRARSEGLSGDLDAATGRRDDLARRGAAKIAGSSNQNPILQGIGNQLADGTDAREIARIGQQIAAKQGELGATTVAALQKMMTELANQQARVAALEGQLKTQRRGK